MSVGGGLAASIEALRVGSDLIRSHSADLVVVVACEPCGAYSVPIWQAAGWPSPEPGALAIVLGATREGSSGSLDLRPLGALERTATLSAGTAEGVRPGWPALAHALDATLATAAC